MESPFIIHNPPALDSVNYVIRKSNLSVSAVESEQILLMALYKEAFLDSVQNEFNYFF